MSRIGKLLVPSRAASTSISVADSVVRVKGPKGELAQHVVPQRRVLVEDGSARVERHGEAKVHRSAHGLTRTLDREHDRRRHEGLSQEPRDSRRRLPRGQGRRTPQPRNSATRTRSSYAAPKGITFTVEGTNKVHVDGIDKQQVGQVAAEIRSLRPPEPYKGKGIRYEGEVVKKKLGKAGKAVGGK